MSIAPCSRFSLQYSRKKLKSLRICRSSFSSASEIETVASVSADSASGESAAAELKRSGSGMTSENDWGLGQAALHFGPNLGGVLLVHSDAFGGFFRAAHCAHVIHRAVDIAVGSFAGEAFFSGFGLQFLFEEFRHLVESCGFALSFHAGFL